MQNVYMAITTRSAAWFFFLLFLVTLVRMHTSSLKSIVWLLLYLE